MLQPGTNILLPREIRHHGVRQFQLDLPVQRVDQIILGLEIRDKSSLGNSCPLGYFGSRASRETALRKEARCGVQDCISLVSALRTRHLNPPWMSRNSTLFDLEQRSSS